MQTRRIGSLEVSAVGLGCNNFGTRLDAARTADVVHAALDAGITFFDTADIYGAGRSEEFLGRALGESRDRAIVASKYGKPMPGDRRGAHPDYIRVAVEDSLRRLGSDRIDLYQQHEPDPGVPIAETLGALTELVVAGKVREIGCSNFSVPQLREAREAPARGPGPAARFASVQNEYSLLHREPERDVLPECERHGMAFIPFFPLENGLLTGKYRLGRPLPRGTRLTDGGRFSSELDDARLRIADELARFAESRGHTMLELAFSWLLRWPSVASVIAGATKPEQVQANAAAGGWRLTADELDEVDAILTAPE